MTWQNPLLVPLAIYGAVVCWKSERMVPTLALGLLLPIMIIAVVLPWQGHGWGYRYIHPVMCNAILLACYGVNKLEREGLSIGRPMMLATVSALLLLPVHAWMARRLTVPFAQSRSELVSIPAEVVIVDASPVPLAEDVVFNQFDLSNRPILLLVNKLDTDDLPAICRHATIAFYDAQRFERVSKIFVWRDPTGPTAHARALRAQAEKVGCRIIESEIPVAN